MKDDKVTVTIREENHQRYGEHLKILQHKWTILTSKS